MIVTVGGVSVRVTFVNDPAGKLMNDAGCGLKGHTSHLTHRRDRVGIDLSIRRSVGESWDEILSPEALAHTRRIAQTIEQRFPFNRIWFGNQGRKRQAKDGGASLPLLADLDSGDVSVIPHPCFLVVVDHRLRQAEALVRVEEDSDGESPLTPVLQGLLAVCAPDFGALMLHAASLVLDGAGYLCVGSSGAGKSTIAAADPGAVLSDDGSWCSQTGGTFSLFPTPFSQIAPGAEVAGPVPLRRILFLEKGNEDRIADLSPGRAMAMLLSNHIHFFRYMCRNAALRAFGIAGQLCQNQPSWTLVFTRDFKPTPFFREMPHEG